MGLGEDFHLRQRQLCIIWAPANELEARPLDRPRAHEVELDELPVHPQVILERPVGRDGRPRPVHRRGHLRHRQKEPWWRALDDLIDPVLTGDAVPLAVTRWEVPGEPVPVTRVLLELRDVASAMTPVAPLGDYRIEARATAGGAQLELASLGGSLRLAGSGRWEPRGGLRLQAQAWGEGADRARLQSLLGLLGQRQGEQTLIRIGG
jgi:hypothetical protein